MRALSLGLALVPWLVTVGSTFDATPAGAAESPSKVPAAAAPAPVQVPAQKTFATPEDAVAAFVAAVKANDTAALLAIFGRDSEPLIESGDPVADEARREKFLASYEQKHALVEGEDAKILETGDDGWPFPIPLVDTAEGWRFDTEEGREEILDRRIGANELYTIQTCLAYVDAQREYYDRNPQKEEPPPYAQSVMSSPGKKDGLYWETKEGEEPSPLGALVADARGEGYTPRQGERRPYHGYLYRVLTAQGPHAPGGAYDYVVKGKMIGGFALVAYPAEYGSSGVMTFIVNHRGDVYEKDLGPNTAKIAGSMKAFDPDDTWIKVDEESRQPPGDTAA